MKPNPCPYCGRDLADDDVHSICMEQARHDWIGDDVEIFGVLGPFPPTGTDLMAVTGGWVAVPSLVRPLH